MIEFVVGFVAGVFTGVLMMAVMTLSKTADDKAEYMYNKSLMKEDNERTLD